MAARQLIRKACGVRNASMTTAGKTPVELAFGRRPRDIIDVETANPQQLTEDLTLIDKAEKVLSFLVMKSYLEVRQREDLRKDTAARSLCCRGNSLLLDR